MKRSGIVAAAFLVAAASFAADPPEILEIRARYQAVADRIARGESFLDDHVYNRNALAIPGLGSMVTTVKAWYGFSPTEEGKTILEKIEVTEVFHGSGESTAYVEYVYDEAGRMVFCFQRLLAPGASGSREKRFYFKDARAVRILEGEKVLDPTTADCEAYRKDILAASDRWRARLGF